MEQDIVEVKKVPCIVMSRVVGYYSGTYLWNKGKKQEFEDRKTYQVAKMLPKEQIERPDVCGCQGEG